MGNIIISGREEEQALLSKIMQSGEAELIAVYGRRRVGKTFLIRNFFSRQMAFSFSGIHNAMLSQQLENFSEALSKAGGMPPLAIPSSWLHAFRLLAEYLAPIVAKERKVIFFDEFPWANTSRSGFLPAFENFWNTWASLQSNLVVIICGSSASWMIQKVINNRGGLHNRVTGRIRLLPFTLSETEAFLKTRKTEMDRYQLLQLYMAMGGIPQYLKEVERGESATQTIDRVCFTKDGLLRDEFKNLFHSLFDDAEDHISVIRALAHKGAGLTRNEIIKTCKLTTGGGATQVLNELTESGFITPYIPFDRTTKDSIYKLTDEYARFYIKFIEAGRIKDEGAWARFSQSPSWKSWSGAAFESVCMKHTPQIKKALGIGSVHTEASMWRQRGHTEQKGAQIDLLIDRADQCINICEMKYSVHPFEVSKAYAKELADKIMAFRGSMQPRKALFLTMVTTYGVRNIGNFPGLIHNEITMDTLFK